MAGDKLPVLVALLICGLSFLVEVRASFEYPRNLAELRRLESATNVNRHWASKDDRAEDVLDMLSMELKRSLEELNSVRSGGDEEARRGAEHHVALIKSYLSVANVREDRCRESDLSDMVFLINVHTGHDMSKDLVNYLKHYTWRQLTLCKPQWDRNFKRATEAELNVKSWSYLLLLMESLVSQVWEASMGRSPARPYPRRLLHRITTRLPVKGLLVFLSRVGALELDDEMRNTRYRDNFEGFLRLVDESLMPTCREVCAKVRPVATPYSVVFQEELFEADQVRGLFYLKDNGRLLEWMAGTRVCCDLVGARAGSGRHNLLREAFLELVGKEEDEGLEELMSRLFGKVE